MNVNNKRYQAVFYQKPTTIDSITTKKEIKTLLLSKYSEEQLANPTEEMQSDILELSLEYMTEKLSKKNSLVYDRRKIWKISHHNILP